MLLERYGGEFARRPRWRGGGNILSLAVTSPGPFAGIHRVELSRLLRITYQLFLRLGGVQF